MSGGGGRGGVVTGVTSLLLLLRGRPSPPRRSTGGWRPYPRRVIVYLFARRFAAGLPSSASSVSSSSGSRTLWRGATSRKWDTREAATSPPTGRTSRSPSEARVSEAPRVFRTPGGLPRSRASPQQAPADWRLSDRATGDRATVPRKKH